MAGYKAEEDIQWTSVWSTGAKTDTYVVNGIIFQSSSPEHPNDIMVKDPNLTAGVSRFDQTEFPEIDWLDVKYYIDIESQDGHDCYVYKRTAEQMATPHALDKLTTEQKKEQADDLAKTPPQMAWIDVKTGLPIKYDTGYSVMSYEYSFDPQRTITPSAAFAPLIKAYAHRMPR